MGIYGMCVRNELFHLLNRQFFNVTRHLRFQILARFANRYGSPKLVEENQAEAARYFNKNILAKTLPPVVQQLDRFSKDQYVSSRVLLHSFDYLRAAVEFGSCYRHLKPYLQFLIENVFLKLFKFNDEDQELFESDKTEFIRVT